LVPGSGVRTRGCLTVSFGNARATLYGGSGSGEPTTCESFQGMRRSRPKGRSAAGRSSAGAAAGPSRTIGTRTRSDHIVGAPRRREAVGVGSRRGVRRSGVVTDDSVIERRPRGQDPVRARHGHSTEKVRGAGSEARSLARGGLFRPPLPLGE